MRRRVRSSLLVRCSPERRRCSGQRHPEGPFCPNFHAISHTLKYCCVRLCRLDCPYVTVPRATGAETKVNDNTVLRVKPERRGSMCPDCRDVRGETLKLSFAFWLRTVTYQCPACGRTWEQMTPDYKPSIRE